MTSLAVTCFLHHKQDCELCDAMRRIEEWSIQEINRFMCTDVATPATAVAIDIFLGAV